MSTTAAEARKAIEAILDTEQDGVFGPNDRTAFANLGYADGAWPVSRPEMTTAGPQTPAGAMSANFVAFMPFIFEWEGTTFENDPDDDGNKGDGKTPGNYGTKYGVDAASHPGIDIVNLTEEQAMAIYWGEWQRDRCDLMASPMAEVFFNCAVNMGLGAATRFSTISDGPEPFIDAQEAHYRAIAAARPTDQKYLRGWLNRTEALRERFNL